MAIGLEPAPHFCVLMIGGIVLDEDCALVAIVLSEQLEEGQVGRSVEDAVLAVVESRAPQLDGAQNFPVLRSPVTQNSGARPTRLQVACKVVSCRKLASSVKISAQFFLWAFF